MEAHAPLSLLPHHLALIRDSAIDAGIAQERGYFSATTIQDLKRYGFAERQCRVPALGVPLWGVDCAVGIYQCRPDSPRTDAKTGKAIKYETPVGAALCLDVHPRAHQFLGDPHTPLWITEGVRKGDSAISNGIDCIIALPGVWGWRGKNADGGLTALTDWDRVALNDRETYIAFDSDVMTKPPVRAALARLKAFLESRGARVRLVFLPAGPGGAKVGLDDFFAAGGTVAELEALAVDGLPEREAVCVPPFPLDVFPPTVRRHIADREYPRAAGQAGVDRTPAHLDGGDRPAGKRQVPRARCRSCAARSAPERRLRALRAGTGCVGAGGRGGESREAA